MHDLKSGIFLTENVAGILVIIFEITFFGIYTGYRQSH